MKSLKRILSLLMAIALILSLAACGGDDATSSDASSKPSTGTAGTVYIDTSTLEKKQTDLFKDLKGTKLRVADDIDLQDWERDFYDQLENETGMTVEIEPLTSNELATKISQAVASGDKRNYFDVGICANSTLLQYVYGNMVKPMDDYIYYDDPVWKYSDASDFNCLELFKFDGHYWGAPSHGYHETFIYYNKTYFEEVKAPDPYTEYYLKDNWTFETFRDTCEAVTKKNADGTTDVYAWATWDILAFPAAAGGEIIQLDENGEWQIKVDSPECLAGLDLIYDSVNNGWSAGFDNGFANFVNRKCAMLAGKPSTAMGSATNARSRMTDEIGCIPFPKKDSSQEKYIAPMSVSGYFIANCAQNPTGAAAYIYYHRVGEQRRDASPYGLESVKRLFTEQDLEMRADYVANCEFAVPYIDGLVGWYSGSRDDFLNVMFVDKVKPATAVDSFKGLISDCLRNTVG